MTVPSANRARLRDLREIGDEDVDLALAALNIAGLHRAGTALAPYLRHLEALAQEVGAYAGKNPDIDRATEALIQVLARRYGYGGDDEAFDDFEAANLATVIDERRGLPVALGILYIHAARAQGWSAGGIDFPGRFLIRLEVKAERRILDPFDSGRVLEPRDMRDLLKIGAGLGAELSPEQYREIGNREILLRLENSLKVRHLRAERFDEALRVIETMLLFAPEASSLWREAGMIHARLDHVREAISALEEFLRLDTSTESRYSASILLQGLRSRLT
ncbi:MAG: tetratricopeptide repeat protein [Rhodospirillales bacterium]|nr:tetratricopeptide repeat protein [Rhodospirillales bacterium]